MRRPKGRRPPEAGSWEWALEWLGFTLEGAEARGLAGELAGITAQDTAIELHADKASVLDRVIRLLRCYNMIEHRARAARAGGLPGYPSVRITGPEDPLRFDDSVQRTAHMLMPYMDGEPAPIGSCALDKAVLDSGDAKLVEIYTQRYRSGDANE